MMLKGNATHYTNEELGGSYAAINDVLNYVFIAYLVFVSIYYVCTLKEPEYVYYRRRLTQDTRSIYRVDSREYTQFY